jgi:hypothetical protein
MLDWNMARANQERYQDMIREAEWRRSLQADMAGTRDRAHWATYRGGRLVSWLAMVLIALGLSR